jgi:hypothetical protein
MLVMQLLLLLALRLGHPSSRIRLRSSSSSRQSCHLARHLVQHQLSQAKLLLAALGRLLLHLQRLASVAAVLQRQEQQQQQQQQQQTSLQGALGGLLVASALG